MKKRGPKENIELKQAVFDLMLKGCVDKEIANALDLTIDMVRKRVKRLMKEYGATNRMQLLAIEIEKLREQVAELKGSA